MILVLWSLGECLTTLWPPYSLSNIYYL